MFARKPAPSRDPAPQAEKPAARRAARQPVNPTYQKWVLQPVPLVQRACDACAEKAAAPGTDGAPGGGPPAGGPGAGGEPLASPVRDLMQSRFGHDFSDVRVHTNTGAAESAKALSAQAYTLGRDVVFGSGQYAPETAAGQRLLAHELAHVVQQRGHSHVPQTSVGVSTPGDSGERAADAAADAVMRGERVPALGPVAPVVQRACPPGKPTSDCIASTSGVVGWQLLFDTGCDDLKPGEDAQLNKLTAGSKLKIHGFAAGEGTTAAQGDLACNRANAVADLVAKNRSECPVVGRFKHDTPPVPSSGLMPPNAFFQSVTIEEIKPDADAKIPWMDPMGVIAEIKAVYHKVNGNSSPASSDLDTLAKRRVDLKKWLEDIPMNLAPAGLKLTQMGLGNYRGFYKDVESLWSGIDAVLAANSHAKATTDTYSAWASGTGSAPATTASAKGIPGGAKFHIDIFGEGRYADAINVGMATRTSTTGVHGSRVPNAIYRKFSSKGGNQLPVADHIADLVTAENGPIGMKGLADEIARIIAPGGTIVLFNPSSEEPHHDEVHKKTGGSISKTNDGTNIETKIVVP